MNGLLHFRVHFGEAATPTIPQNITSVCLTSTIDTTMVATVEDIAMVATGEDTMVVSEEDTKVATVEGTMEVMDMDMGITEIYKEQEVVVHLWQ